MKIKLGVAEILCISIAKLTQLELKASFNIRLKMILNRLQSDVDLFTKQRIELINTYGEDGAISPASENWDQFIKEYAPITDMETEVDIKILPVTYLELLEMLDEFGEKLDSLNLTNDEITVLTLICKEE